MLPASRSSARCTRAGRPGCEAGRRGPRWARLTWATRAPSSLSLKRETSPSSPSPFLLCWWERRSASDSELRQRRERRGRGRERRSTSVVVSSAGRTGSKHRGTTPKSQVEMSALSSPSQHLRPVDSVRAA
eukprot:3086206-Rhodomonas_salina.1